MDVWALRNAMHVLNGVSVLRGNMRGSRKFCQRGSTFDNIGFFLVTEGKEDPNTTISRSSLARQQNTI